MRRFSWCVLLFTLLAVGCGDAPIPKAPTMTPELQAQIKAQDKAVEDAEKQAARKK